MIFYSWFIFSYFLFSYWSSNLVSFHDSDFQLYTSQSFTIAPPSFLSHLPEFSLDSDSESEVSEDSEVFSGRLGSWAMSMGVSLYSWLLWSNTERCFCFSQWQLEHFPICLYHKLSNKSIFFIIKLSFHTSNYLFR